MWMFHDILTFSWAHLEAALSNYPVYETLWYNNVVIRYCGHISTQSNLPLLSNLFSVDLQNDHNKNITYVHRHCLIISIKYGFALYNIATVHVNYEYF